MSPDHALNVHASNDLILQCISAAVICFLTFIRISLLCGTQCTMNIVHGTTQVTDEQIITILHLVLQVNCSPSLKEYLHSPVMTHLACNIQRTASILCANGVVCACVWCCVRECTCIFVCCMCMCVWLCVHVHQCVHSCVSAFQMVDTNLQIYLHVPVITQAQNNAHTVLAISIFFLLLHTYN